MTAFGKEAVSCDSNLFQIEVPRFAGHVGRSLPNCMQCVQLHGKRNLYVATNAFDGDWRDMGEQILVEWRDVQLHTWETLAPEIYEKLKDIIEKLPSRNPRHLIIDPSGSQYTVEGIVMYQVINKQQKICIKWDGFCVSECTWELLDGLGLSDEQLADMCLKERIEEYQVWAESETKRCSVKKSAPARPTSAWVPITSTQNDNSLLSSLVGTAIDDSRSTPDMAVERIGAQPLKRYDMEPLITPGTKRVKEIETSCRNSISPSSSYSDDNYEVPVFSSRKHVLLPNGKERNDDTTDTISNAGNLEPSDLISKDHSCISNNSTVDNSISVTSKDSQADLASDTSDIMPKKSNETKKPTKKTAIKVASNSKKLKKADTAASICNVSN